eukprot:scaffold45952_cov30-Tisochrysis_lutea.AAC.2
MPSERYSEGKLRAVPTGTRCAPFVIAAEGGIILALNGPKGHRKDRGDQEYEQGQQNDCHH